MAITKTTFTGATITEQEPEILAWLQANATEYFDIIVRDDETTPSIVCSVGDKVALTLVFQSSIANRFYVKLANEAEISSYGTLTKYNYGVVTDHGVAINYSYPNSTTGTTLFITKSDSDSLIMTMMCTTSNSSNTAHFYAGDFSNSAAWHDYFGADNSSDIWGELVSVPAGLTTLTPICLAGCESYTPNLFLMRFSQFVGVEGKLTINGEEYWSNGYLALKG